MNTALASHPAKLLVVAFTIAACANDDAQPGASDRTRSPDKPPPTACALVTGDDGSAALGEAVDEPVEQIVNPGGPETAALSQCTIQASGTPARTLTLFLRRSPVSDNTPDSVRRTYAESGLAVEDVPGLGDAAFWVSSQLHVFVGGNLYYTVTLHGLGDAIARERATGLARRINARARGLSRARKFSSILTSAPHCLSDNCAILSSRAAG